MSRPRLLDRRRWSRAAGVGAAGVAGARAGLLALALTSTACTGDRAPVPSAPAPPATRAGPLLDRTAVAGGITQVVADPAFLDALDRLGLAPRVTGGARPSAAAGTFAFPVTGGALAVGPDRALEGELRHDGSALLLTSGTSTVALGDLVLDGAAGLVTATVSVDGAVRADDLPVLALDTTGVEVSADAEPAGPVVVRGLRLALTAQGAEALNDVHAPEGFAPGAPVGALTLTLEPQ